MNEEYFNISQYSLLKVTKTTNILGLIKIFASVHKLKMYLTSIYLTCLIFEIVQEDLVQPDEVCQMVHTEKTNYEHLQNIIFLYPQLC